MTIEFISEQERSVVEAEQIKVFFHETNDQNIAGAVVLSLVVYLVHDGIPAWTWQPALLSLYTVTLIRAWLIWQFHRAPTYRSNAQWGRGQTIAGGLSGICWGFANTAMLAHVSTEFQLFILTVVTVAAATNASEGFSYTPPSRAFILLCLSPVILWLLTVGDRFHYILALLLVIFVPMTIMQGQKRNRVFVEAQQLRFRNEALANELKIQRDKAEQEVTERESAIRALADANRSLREIQFAMDRVGIAIHWVNSNTGRFVYVNECACEMLGYKKEEMLALGLPEIDPHFPFEKLEANIVAIAPGSNKRFETENRRKDGSLIPVEVTVYRLHDANEGLNDIIGFVTDMSPRKEVERILIAAKESAEAANLAKSRFLAAASHDLRQPIQAINLFQHSLAKTGLNEEQKRICDFIGLSSQNLGNLLDALLDISKLDAGAITPTPEIIDVHDLFQRIHDEFAPMATAKSLRFKLYFPFREMSLFTDGKLLQSLMKNLIGNAIKYTERGGVLISIRRRSDQAIIQVWDTGIGIAPEHMEAVFDEYFQVGNPERDKAKGLGLGLSIAKRVAKLLKTDIVCRSRLSKGSVFEFRLPLGGKLLKQEHNPSGQAAIRATTVSRLAGRRFVVIEDDVMVAKAIQISLELLGLRPTTYGCAEEAMSDSEIASADYYVSDLRLPGVNGIEFLNAIQQRVARNIRAVLLTGDTLPERIEVAQRSRWPVLFKPVEIEELLSALEQQEQHDTTK